ncbi:FAD-dependent oxidoreductase [Halalkalirubrum salinum]|uniref:FAD-dependent oxidoreductase n=1 Tax=Halalkalirubrum salinum TaxID=2563889 RepID=UPI0010FB703A|nr:FAD-dependent oxidoreductase [Halalkalirubrum salinum]
MRKQVLVVGGNAAGMSTATRLRRLDEVAEITVIEATDHVSYASCGLPYHLNDTVPESELAVMGTDQLSAAFNLDIRTGERVVDIVPETQHATIEPRDGEPYELGYDELVLATGAEPLVPPMFDVEAIEHCHTLRTVDDAIDIRQAVDTAERALVIGGGYIGIEVAENLTESGHEVVIAELLDQVMPNTLGAEMAALVEAHLEAHGVDLRLGTGVEDLTETDYKAVLATMDGTDHEFDLVVISTGVRPRTELAEAVGLELHDSGAIPVDERLRTEEPSIHAVGDAVAVPSIFGERAWIPLGGPANREGRVAANDIAGHDDALAPVLDTAIAKVFNLDVGTVGLTETALIEDGRPYEAIYTAEPDHAGYYPGATDIHFKLLFDPDDGTILGAQAIGEAGVDKRTDVLATAISHGDTVFEIRDLDLAYAPPYSAAKDPVNILGMIGANIVEGVAEIIHLDEFLDTREAATVVDTRPPAMRETQGSIPGDEHVPLGKLRSWAADREADEEVVTYCKIGKSSYMATRILNHEGIEARSLTGGYYRYRAAEGADD